MGHFRFRIFDDGAMINDVGDKFEEFGVARREGIRSACAFLCDEAKKGRFGLTGRIDILNAAGQIILAVPFTEAVGTIPAIVDDAPRMKN